MGNKISSEKEQALIDTQLFISKVNSVISLVLAGKSESEACRAVGLKVSFFRNFVVKDFENNKTRKKEFNSGLLSWKDNLLSDILWDEDVEVLDDFDKVLEDCLNNMNDRCKKAIQLYYIDNMTLEQAGKELGVSTERFRCILNKALRKLRSNWKLFLYGEDKVNELKQLNQNIDEINKEIEEKRKELDILIALSNEQDRLLSKAKIENDSKKDITIEELNLSSRAYNVLHRAKIDTVGDLLKLNYTKLCNIRSLGLKSIDEIIMCIHNLGYTDWMKDKTNAE